MSKGRLAPLRTVTIPPLELCAAVLAVRLNVLLRRELDIHIVRSSFFTDSAIARAYINNESKRFKVFVANRMSEIRQHSSFDQWHHSDGKQNPADILSRGCDVEKMPSNWFYGPHFLSQFLCDWPADTAPPELNDDCETLPSHDTHVHVCTTDTPVHPVDKLSQHYRSFYRMKRAISWLLRFKAYLRHDVIPRGAKTASELNAAERLVLMHVQSREYPDELAVLRAGKPVARSSPVLKLDPMIHDGFLVGWVVGGRLCHSRLMFQTRHPIILSANHLVSKMIVHDTHVRHILVLNGLFPRWDSNTGLWMPWIWSRRWHEHVWYVASCMHHPCIRKCLTSRRNDASRSNHHFLTQVLTFLDHFASNMADQRQSDTALFLSV